MHLTVTKMYHVCHEGGHRVRRSHTVWAEAIRLHLVARVKRAGDRPGRSGLVSSFLRVPGEDRVRLTVYGRLPCSPPFHDHSSSSLSILFNGQVVSEC